MPTYALYYTASGFGRLGRNAAALLFTLLNTAAAALLFALALEHAGLGGRRSRAPGRPAPLLFLFLAGPAPGVIMNGQTPLFMACAILGAFLLARRRPALAPPAAFLGAAGILVKPNTAPLLLALLGGRAAARAEAETPPVLDPRPVPSPRRFLAWSAAGLIAWPALALFLPGGVRRETFAEFFSTVLPDLARNAAAPTNISLLGALHALFPSVGAAWATPLFLVGAAVAAALARRGALPLGAAIVAALALSPFTWTIYAVLALPVQCAAFAGEPDPARRTLALLSAGLLALDRALPGFLALALLWRLSGGGENEPGLRPGPRWRT